MGHVIIRSNRSSPWIHEPGLDLITDYSYNVLPPIDGWSLQSLNGTQAIVTRGDEPYGSPCLNIGVTNGMDPDTEPVIHEQGLSNLDELYAAWWWRWDSDFHMSSAGLSKMMFMWVDPSGQAFIAQRPEVAYQEPHLTCVDLEFTPRGGYPQTNWPNKTETEIYRGTWYFFEWYWKLDSGGGNGIMRWWVDGALNGELLNLTNPAQKINFFQLAPTIQEVPSSTRYMQCDHIRLTGA